MITFPKCDWRDDCTTIATVHLLASNVHYNDTDEYVDEEADYCSKHASGYLAVWAREHIEAYATGRDDDILWSITLSQISGKES